MSKLKDGKTMYLVNSKDIIELITIIKFDNYPLGYGYLKFSDSHLYAVTETNLENIYGSKDEAEKSIYNIFTVMD